MFVNNDEVGDVDVVEVRLHTLNIDHNGGRPWLLLETIYINL